MSTAETSSSLIVSVSSKYIYTLPSPCWILTIHTLQVSESPLWLTVPSFGRLP